MSGTLNDAHYSQVDAKLLIGEVQRLHSPGVSERVSAGTVLIPPLGLGHLPHLRATHAGD